MKSHAEIDFRTRLQDWLPKLVLAPSFAVTLLFVYGSLKQGFPNTHVNTGLRRPGLVGACSGGRPLKR